jgi:hypothetical protein
MPVGDAYASEEALDDDLISVVLTPVPMPEHHIAELLEDGESQQSAGAAGSEPKALRLSNDPCSVLSGGGGFGASMKLTSSRPEYSGLASTCRPVTPTIGPRQGADVWKQLGYTWTR